MRLYYGASDLPMVLAETSTFDVLLVSIVLIALVIGGFLIALLVKRRMKDMGVETAPPAGFMLSDLRQMHKSGQISAEEFERAKQKIVEAARRSAERKPTDRVEPKPPVR